jgi:hypothetical protein
MCDAVKLANVRVKCEEYVDEINITCEIVSYCSGHQQLSYEWNSFPG